jgi:1,4-dihydroxy-2-naphthoyl-CoA hydrolase
MTQEEMQRLMPGLPSLLGLTVRRAEPEMVVAELLVRPEICTLGDTIHGGAIMAFADTVGAARKSVPC